MSSGASLIFDYLRMVLPSLPFLAACIVGLALALVRRQRYPGPCTFLALGLLILLILGVIMPMVYAWLPRGLDEIGLSRISFGTVYTVINVVANLVRTLSLVLLILAVFAGRGPAPVPRPADWKDRDLPPEDRDRSERFRPSRG